jgi:hypothetical protein
MTVPLPLFETEYARRIRARLEDILPCADNGDAELIGHALDCGFDALSGEQVDCLNIVLRRFAAPAGESE